jgi:hypothetical protein
MNLKYELPLSKLVCAATDGTPKMSGNRGSLMAKLQNKINTMAPNCILNHVLCSSYKYGTCANSHKKISTLFQACGLNQRQFASLMRDLDRESECFPCRGLLASLPKCLKKVLGPIKRSYASGIQDSGGGTEQ